MYIIEFILKQIKALKNKTLKRAPEEEQAQECEHHVFLPIDSTKQYLACKNCGQIIKGPGL